jgi:uncharacterized SAM-binding protein YcdF (DUF218 family)
MGYIIVLSGGINKNGVLNRISKSRVETALKVNKNDIIIFSGKYSRLKLYTPRINEARAMHEYARSLGFKGNYILEDKSMDTVQNIRNSMKLIKKNHEIIIVTSQFHEYRVKYILKKMNLKAKIITDKDNSLIHWFIERIYLIYYLIFNPITF